jgi:hypothetical protein
MLPPYGSLRCVRYFRQARIVSLEAGFSTHASAACSFSASNQSSKNGMRLENVSWHRKRDARTTFGGFKSVTRVVNQTIDVAAVQMWTRLSAS